MTQTTGNKTYHTQHWDTVVSKDTSMTEVPEKYTTRINNHTQEVVFNLHMNILMKPIEFNMHNRRATTIVMIKDKFKPPGGRHRMTYHQCHNIAQ